MGKFTDKGLTGTVGPVVIYEMYGQKYARTKPTRNKEKRKKNPVNMEFGSISKNGSPMVKYLKDHGNFLFPMQLQSYNDLRKWMKNLQAAEGADRKLLLQTTAVGNLNPAADLRDFIQLNFLMEVTTDGITLSLPAINPVNEIRAPANTGSLRLHCILETSPYQEPCSKVHSSAEIIMAYQDELRPAQQLHLPTTQYFKPGDMAMLMIALEFYEERTGALISEIKYLPAAVVAMGRIDNN